MPQAAPKRIRNRTAKMLRSSRYSLRFTFRPFSLHYAYSLHPFIRIYHHFPMGNCSIGSETLIVCNLISQRCAVAFLSLPAIRFLFRRKYSTAEEGKHACSRRKIPGRSGNPHFFQGKQHGADRILDILRASKCSGFADFDDECEGTDMTSAVRSQAEQAAILAEAEKIYAAVKEDLSSERGMDGILEQFKENLSHSVVLQVLGRLREAPNLALRFFSMASQQLGHNHDCHSYNMMIDILGKAGQFDVAHKLFDEMRTEISLVTVDTFVIFMRRYAAARRPKDTEQFFHRMVSFTSRCDAAIFNIFLDSLCKNKLAGEAREAFLRLKHKFLPDRKSYSILLSGCCRSKNWHQAGNIINEMTREGFGLNIVICNTLLNSFCKQGYLRQALELWDFMKGREFKLNVKSYTTMIHALGVANKSEEAFEILAEMREKICSPNVATYSSLITGLCMTGKLSDAYRLLDEMVADGLPPDSMTYNCIFKVLCRLQKVDEVLSLFEKMENAGCMPSIHTYKMLLKMFCKLGQLDVAIALWSGMDAKCCAPDVDCYFLMIDGCFARGRLQEALGYFQEMSEKGIKVQDRVHERFLSELSKAGKAHLLAGKFFDSRRQDK